MRTARRSTIAALCLALPLGLAACGSSGPTKSGTTGGGGADAATYWYLTA